VDALVEGVDEGVTWPTWKCCAAPGWDEVYGWGRLGAARAIDYDRDGWSGSLEQYLTTDAYDPCPPGDAWRPDFTQSGSVNATDVLSLKPVFGSASVRHDLDRSGAVSIGDVLALKRWFGLSC
jgi:hypothetical protein